MYNTNTTSTTTTTTTTTTDVSAFTPNNAITVTNPTQQTQPKAKIMFNFWLQTTNYLDKKDALNVVSTNKTFRRFISKPEFIPSKLQISDSDQLPSALTPIISTLIIKWFKPNYNRNYSSAAYHLYQHLDPKIFSNLVTLIIKGVGFTKVNDRYDIYTYTVNLVIDNLPKLKYLEINSSSHNSIDLYLNNPSLKKVSISNVKIVNLTIYPHKNLKSLILPEIQVIRQTSYGSFKIEDYPNLIKFVHQFSESHFFYSNIKKLESHLKIRNQNPQIPFLLCHRNQIQTEVTAKLKNEEKENN